MTAEQIEEGLLVDTGLMEISVQEIYRPVLKLSKIPDIPLKNEKDSGYQWWKEQIDRCLYGWIAPDGKYLNGYLYFYLNFVKIPIRIEGTARFVWDHPLYRDNDQIVLDQIWENTYRLLPNGKQYFAKNHIEGKPRGVAWTTYTLLGVALYTYIFRNDAQIGLAYPDQNIRDTERDWFIQAWTDLHPMFKRTSGKEHEIIENSKEAFSTGYTVGSKNKRVINKVWFDVIGQNDKAGVYKGKRLNLMIAAEAGLWVGDSLKNYLTENEPSIKLGDEQWGMCLIGGTSNAIINKSTAYYDIFVNHHVYNATRHFTSKTMVLRGFIDYKTGRSKQEEALIQITKLRDSKKDDPGAYQQEIIENPLRWEEAFIPNDVTAVYSTAVINEQLSKIKMEGLSNLWVRGKIEYMVDVYGAGTKRVRFIQDMPGIREEDRGDWIMNLEGKPNPMFKNLHVAGIDDRYKSRKETKVAKSGDSRNAMVIWRRKTSYPIKSDIPCAIYFGNKADMLVAYEEFYKGMLLYDIEKTMYENNAEGFIMFLRDYKKEINRLYYYDGEYGLKVSSPEIKAELTYLCTQFLAANREKNITHPMILESLLDWGIRNTDVGSAFHQVLKLMELMEDSVVTQLRPESEQKAAAIVKLGVPSHYIQPESGSMQRIKLGPRAA